MDLLNNLNEAQYKAVVTNNRYVRIIAGAGSGKTRVLITRIAYLIRHLGVFPGSILAITFTNKAANEMKDRIYKMLNDEGSGVWISTIHSLCVRILREDITAINYPRNFTVLDSDDQKSILKEAYKELGVDRQKISFNSMLDYIGGCKGSDVSVQRALEIANKYSAEYEKAKVYEYYVNRQKALYALDFDDLLLVTVKIFKSNPNILDKWMRRYSHIHVDEFQDIDPVQYELISLLAGVKNEVYVVGDPDQTIYTWRGADVNIIMDFEKQFAGADTIILNQNYRSSKNILSGANSLIKYNAHRVEKDLFSSKEDGELITHFSASSDEYEALWIAKKINEIKEKGQSYRDCAILYRSNYLSRAIEKGLLDARIPYRIYGGVRFYDRAEIKDALSYLRMIVKADDLAFMRVINNPRRGLGNKTIDTISDRAKQLNTSMYEVIKSESLFSSRAQSTLNRFVNMIEGFKAKVESTPIYTLLEMVLDETGYRAMLEENKETERLENLKELIKDVQSFQVNYPEYSLDDYLQVVSLYGDKEEIQNGDFVQLMTIHAAKGLEFDTVFVIGMSDGIFPSDRSMQEGSKGLEEERRLAYVAYTRAEKKLYLTEASGFSFVLSRARVKSRFIGEIDEAFIEHIGANFEYAKPKEFTITEDTYMERIPFENRVNQNLNKKDIKKGDLITHTMYGDGVVLKIEDGTGEIAFGFPHGIKKMMVNHPSITKK